jgi:hypothetical protein
VYSQFRIADCYLSFEVGHWSVFRALESSVWRDEYLFIRGKFYDEKFVYATEAGLSFVNSVLWKDSTGARCRS